MKQKISLLVKIFLFFTVFFLGSTIVANATSITTSASGSDFEDEYSYTFTITADDTDSTIYHAELVNATDGSVSDALIDRILFNMNATLNTDFVITNIDPSTWTIGTPTGGAIAFDYVSDDGQGGGVDDRIFPGQSLTFDFDFVDDYSFPENPFILWTGTGASSGGGTGGGEVSGQVAVSFQRLGGEAVDGSDLLASNWGGGGGGNGVIPEPATFMLFGIGLLGLANVSRRKK